ncbi:MAG: GNAT family N-acetyltransferase [Candidatus Hermodarchaeota archaeon]
MQVDLGEGLIMRTATAADEKAIERVSKTVFGKEVSSMIDRLFNYHHDSPPSDHFLIMDTTKQKVVSYFCLSRTTCVLNGTEFPVGHMEIVATLPEYRHRGFIRKLNELFEQRVAEYQLPLLVIIGIPYFYRTLGYEYAINFDGTLTVPTELIPRLKKNEKEPVTIEEITEQTFDQYLRARKHRNSYLDFYRIITPADYPYLTHGKLGDDSVYRFFVVKHDTKPVGSFILSIGWGFLEMHELWVKNLTHIPTVLRYSKTLAKRRRLPIRIYLPSRPALQPVLEGLARSKFSRPYAWYVRIPSVKHFMETISPVLEKRLAQSDFAHLSDSLRINWYRAGIELVFKRGNIEKINEIKREEIKDMHVRVPFPVIYQLIMGYKTIDELHQTYPDVETLSLKLPIVRVLFPKIRAQLTPDF